MSTFATIAPTSDSLGTDEFLLDRGAITYKQNRNQLIASFANARWDSTNVYLAGTVVIASDLKQYQAVTDSGTGTTAGVVDPVTDTAESHWKVVENYKDSGGLVNGEIETNDFVKTPEIRVDKVLHTDGTETTPVEIPSLENRFIAAAVTFKGTGVIAIRSEFNVTTVTRTSTGVYRITFSESIKGEVNAQFTSSTLTCQVASLDNFNKDYIDVICNDASGRADALIACLTVYSL